MLRRIVLLFAVASATALGCSSSERKETVESEFSIAFVTNQVADFWTIAEAGCNDAAQELGVEVEVRKPNPPTAVEQKRIVEDLLTRGVDAIAISPLDANNQTEWINQIAGRVPLITQDSDAPDTNRLVYVGLDNYQAGRMCGELIKDALPNGGAVMLFVGRLEQDNSKHRRQGVIDELLGRDRSLAYYQTSPDAFDPAEGRIEGDTYTILGTMLDTGAPEIAQQKAEDAITSYPEMNAMVGLFEYNPPACYQALQKAGKLGQIKLIGFDENRTTLQAIKDGTCAGTIVQDPYEYGYQSVRVLKSILDGDRSVIPESKFIDIPAKKITGSNVDEFWTDLNAKTGN